MKLSNDLITRFAKVTTNKPVKREQTLYGTVVKQDGKTYVQLDGSNILTPTYTTVTAMSGDRVMVMIKNHTAIITGNLKSPAARSEDVALIDKNIEACAKTATDFIRVDDEGRIVFGDHESEFETDLMLEAKALRFYIRSAMDLYKPYYEVGDTVDIEWTGAGFVTNSSQNVHFSIPLAKPVIGTPTVSVSSINGLIIRQNGAFTHASSESQHVEPTYSATLSCDGGIVNVVATLSSTANAVNDAPCGITASLTIAFS